MIIFLRVLSLSYLCDTNDHVGDVGADGPDSGQLFAKTEPLLNFEGLLVNLRDVDLQVAEALHQLAPWALNGHGASLHAALDPVRDGDVLTDVDSLHPENVEGCNSTVTRLREPESFSSYTAHALSGLVDLSRGFTDSGLWRNSQIFDRNCKNLPQFLEIKTGKGRSNICFQKFRVALKAKNGVSYWPVFD